MTLSIAGVPPGAYAPGGLSAEDLRLGDQQIDVAHLGGQTAVPITVVVAEPLLGALVAVGTEHSGDLQLNELLQAVACQLGNQLTGSAAIQ